MNRNLSCSVLTAAQYIDGENIILKMEQSRGTL